MSTAAPIDNERKDFDPLINQFLAKPFAEWNPALMSILAHRIEDSFYEKLKGPLETTQDELSALLHHVLATAPEATANAVLRDEGDPAIRAAYLLGNLSFAHQLVSSVVGRRPDDEFFEAFENDFTNKIIAALSDDSRSTSEIVESTGLALKDVEAKLRELMGLGITEFRRRFGGGVAGVTEYFLTPAAKATMQVPSKS